MAGADKAAHCLQDLEVDQVRSVECLFSGFNDVGDPPAKRSEQHEFERSRRVENDHLCSRSWRITSAGLGCTATGTRDRSRCINSSVVGRSSPRCSSARAYAERDIPDSAALAFSLRCTSSGTFRT